MEQERTTKGKERMLIALKQTLGIVTPALEMAGISRPTYYDWLKKDEKFKSLVDEIQEVQVDFVESKLMDGIQNGNAQLIQYYLTSKGKARGYKSRFTKDDDDQRGQLPPGEEKTIILLPHNDRDDIKLLDSGSKE